MPAMDIPVTQLPPGDPRLVEAIVGQLKSKGIFDQFRKECLADVDTKVSQYIIVSFFVFFLRISCAFYFGEGGMYVVNGRFRKVALLSN